MNVSRRSAASAAKVRDEGTPELINAVASGAIMILFSENLKLLYFCKNRLLLLKGKVIPHKVL